jgi:hypothetical protein
VNDFQTGQPRQTPPPSNVQGRQGDAALVERCRNGEMAAFEELYKTHATRLYNVACRLLGSPADAEDLVQEAFLQAHRKLDTFRGDAALGTWLHRLLVNLGLDHLRSRAGRTAALSGWIWRKRSRGCPKGAARHSCCTTSKAWTIVKWRPCSV